MAVPSFKTLSKSLKYVDKSYGFLRAGSCLSSQFGPRHRKSECTENLSRTFCNTVILHQGMLGSSIDPKIFTRSSELQNNKTDIARSRDFMNVSGVTSPTSLTSAVESGANFYFDTHKLVTTLQSHGFSLDQAETITDCLTEILSNGAAGMSKYMVSI